MLLERPVPVLPERPRAPDEILPGAALRLVDPERRRAVQRRAEKRVRDPVRVQPVPRLVHRRPDRLEVVGPVARREADVPVRERRAERVCGRVEPPGVVVEAHRPEHALGEGALRLGREVAVEERRVDLRRRRHELGERRAQHGEDLLHLGRQHPGLVVVEERRVRAVGPLEALDVAPLQLDVRPQIGEERREVARAAGLDPRVVAAGGLQRHLGAELGRHAARLLPVAPGHAYEAAVVGVVRLRLDERLGPIEESPHLVVRESLVRDPAERRELLRARLGAVGRHRHALVPAEHACCATQIGDLCETRSQVEEGRLHECHPTGGRVGSTS